MKKDVNRSSGSHTSPSCARPTPRGAEVGSRMQDTDGATPGGGAGSSPGHSHQAARGTPPPRLVVRVETDGRTAVLGLAGEFDRSSEAEVRAGLQEALEQSESGRVNVDLSKLTFISFGGIAFLVSAIGRHGRGRLSFRASETPKVGRAFARVGLDLNSGTGEDASGHANPG
jgi:anti-anti-sigma factor